MFLNRTFKSGCKLTLQTKPPTLTLLEIGDLSIDRFRGILRLGYQGDAWLEVRCRVQANPLSHNPHLTFSTLPLSTPLLASQPLLVPMTLRLSNYIFEPFSFWSSPLQKGLLLCSRMILYKTWMSVRHLIQSRSLEGICSKKLKGS